MVVSKEAQAKAIRANSWLASSNSNCEQEEGEEEEEEEEELRIALGGRRRAENVEPASQWLTGARRCLFCYLALPLSAN